MTFSEDFMALINAMLSYDPTHRPSIPEIYAHPWLKNGPMPTHEQICAEFNKRKQYVDRAIAKEKAMEEQKKAQEKKKVPTMAFGPIRAHRGPDANAPVNDTTWTDIANRFADEKMTDYKFSEIDAADVKNGCLSNKTLSKTDFLQAIYWIAEQLGAHVITENNNKMKIITTVQDDNIEMKVKFYQDKQGVNYSEFIKQEGPIMSYYGFVGEIADEFVKLTSM